MEVAFIHTNAPFSEGTGAGHSATQIILGLTERGHEVTVYCDNQRPPEEVPFDVEVLSYDPTFPRNTWRARNSAIEARAAELGEFDIVHSYPTETIPSMAAVAEHQAETVVTLNAYAGVCPKNNLQFFGRSACGENGAIRCAACSFYESVREPVFDSHRPPSRLARIAHRPVQATRRLSLIKESERVADIISRFHALSGHLKSKYAEFGYPSRSIRVIPNILDERFDRSHESDFQPPFRLLHVGYLKPHKGVTDLVPALEEVRNEYGIDATLTVVGDGPCRGEMEQQASDLGVAAYVDFQGHIAYDSLPPLYASHDLFVYPGQWDEPFGRVFLEALAAGTPVVATDVGAAREILGDSGVVVENGSDLSSAVADVLEPRSLRELSEHTGDTIAGYRKERVVDEIEEMYLSCAG